MKKIIVSLFAVALVLAGCSKSGGNLEESNIKDFRDANNEEVQSMLDYAIEFEEVLDEDTAEIYKSIDLSDLSDGEYLWLVSNLADWLNANYLEGAMLPLFSDTVLSFYELSNELNDLANEKEIEKVAIKK